MGLAMVVVTTAWGYECLLYHRGGGRWPMRESDRSVAVMLECDVNLYCWPARRSRNGGQWSHRGLHGGKVSEEALLSRRLENGARFTCHQNLNRLPFRE
jgi:hypothetical protein